MAVSLQGISTPTASFPHEQTADSNPFMKSVSYLGNPDIASTTQQVINTVQAGQAPWLAWLGRGLLLAVRAVPGTLVWLITFTTITLPTFLFALFSTSLTFTMNATTLSVRFAPRLGEIIADPL